MTFALHINHIVSKAAKVLNCECDTYSTLTKPAQYVIHTSTTKSIYVIDRIYSVEQLTAWSLCNYDRYIRSSVTLVVKPSVLFVIILHFRYHLIIL